MVVVFPLPATDMLPAETLLVIVALPASTNPDIEALFNQLVSTYSVEIDKYLNNTIIPQMESLLKTVSLSLISVLKAMWNLIILCEFVNVRF